MSEYDREWLAAYRLGVRTFWAQGRTFDRADLAVAMHNALLLPECGDIGPEFDAWLDAVN